MRKKRRWDEEFCKMCEKKGGLGGKLGCFAVAPYAGAWIEIILLMKIFVLVNVAPYAGAWIEIGDKQPHNIHCLRRSLRGSVD